MTKYDVFLSHNSADKPAVEELARRLADEVGLNPFLDKWHLIPGDPWQEAIEQALDQSRACAVFVGPGGIGPWENEEMRAAIEQCSTDRSFRVIPVLLPGAERGERGRLPAFLVRATWVEFRQGLDDTEAFHRLVAGIKGQAPGRGLGEVVYKDICPYRGLQVFEAQHAPFFFGREAAIQWLINELRPSARPGEKSERPNRFLAVIGPSGSGKSSLVRAGLVPALQRGDLPGSQDWPLRVFRPGHYPLESLAMTLIHLLTFTSPPLSLVQLINGLAADQRQLHQAAQLSLAPANPEQNIVLVVDQFEELFTLCQDEGQRRAFIDNLLYASAVEDGRIVVIMTVRADFYGKCANYPELAARITDHQMLVTPMVPEELRQAIERPAQMVGLEFEPGLVETLLDEVKAEPGILPLLQHTLLELWERRHHRRLTFAAYHVIGGIQGAIAHRAESIYAGFNESQRTITRRVMLRLTQPGEGTEDTRRQASLTELLPVGDDSQAIEVTVRELADARLLTTSKDQHGNEIVDVAHEALIRGWPRLRGWIDEDRAALRIHHRLTEAAIEWQRHGHDDSYLYRGARLLEVEEWAAANPGEINPLEQAFLRSSTQGREQELAEKEAQRQRELEMVRQLAIEQQQRAEEQARLKDIAQRRVGEMQVLNDIGRALSDTLQFGEVLNRIMEQVEGILKAEAGWLLLVDAATGELVFQIGLGRTRRIEQFRLSREQGLAGEVAATSKAVLVVDVDQDERHFEEFEQRVDFSVQSILCVPLILEGRVIGVLEVMSKRGHYFTLNDLELLDSIVPYAVVAIKNTDFYERVLAARDRVISAEEQARTASVRDLQDGPIQLVAGIMLRLDFCQTVLHKEPSLLEKELLQTRKLAEQALHQLRNITFELQGSSVLVTEGLVAALETFLKRRQQDIAGVQTTKLMLKVKSIHPDGRISPQPTRVEAAIFTIVQETVSNAIKHAQADQIVVYLQETSNVLRTVIADNGRGFDVSKTMNNYAQRGSLGMIDIRERAEVIGGELSIDSTLGRGTRITLTVPKAKT